MLTAEDQIDDKTTQNEAAMDTIDNQEHETDNKVDTTDEITELKMALEESRDKYLRLFAEFDNYKKRTQKERLDLFKTAAQETIVALLPVLDDFERAKKASEAPDSPEVFSEGVNLVYHKLNNILTSKGLKGMDSNGADFDAEAHEAITEIPVQDDALKGKVIDTVERGYYLYDKIIRYAKVVVGK